MIERAFKMDNVVSLFPKKNTDVANSEISDPKELVKIILSQQEELLEWRAGVIPKAVLGAVIDPAHFSLIINQRESEILKLRGNVLWYEQQQKALTGRVNILGAENKLLAGRLRRSRFQLSLFGFLAILWSAIYFLRLFYLH